jgi:patatin-related protein
VAYQREVRIGMVLYGGVSLAVYENGVAQELHRAIRGEGVYGLVAKLIDSDIVVDIISGTSAGGVNGIMLAYALANKRAFAPSAELWRNQGDIQKLLREQHDPEASSILNSTYYQTKLKDCFAQSLVDDKSAPEISELDLFVTSTDANGVISTVFDDLGHAIDIKNHRILFKLSCRGTRKNDFAVPADELAKLCRMTSCFPSAFQPVCVDATEKNFFTWGKLGDPAVYLDGGILNNKPFTSTIDAIATRTATREVERFLIYVEPNPEQFAPSPANPSSPTIVQAALSSLVSIPGYQSIAGDLEAIEAHNERAGRLSNILEQLPAAPESTPECLDKAGVVPEKTDGFERTAYYAARLIQLRDEAVEGILDDSKGRGYFPAVKAGSARDPESGEKSGSRDSGPVQDDRRSGWILVKSFDAWRGDGRVTLMRYDIFFRMRRAKHLSNALMRAVKADRAVPEPVWNVVNHYFKLYEMANWAMVRWLTQADFNWRALSSEYPDLELHPKKVQQQTLEAISNRLWAQVEDRLGELIYAGIQVPTDPTPKAREAFHEQLLELLKSSTRLVKAETNLLDAIDDALREALKGLGENEDAASRAIGGMLRNEFCHFLEVDRQLFLLQVGSGFESMDTIRVVRFSPLDAQRCLSKGTVEDKVRGSTLAAFGGFFKKSWRANDIMVGRLDAACLLVECLLTQERLAALAPRRATAPIRLTQAQLQTYFPRLGAKAQQLATLINDYLAALGTATKEQTKEQIEDQKSAWNELVEQIVCASHDEIQAEEWPRVVACSIEQEYDWGQYRQNTAIPSRGAFDVKNLVWNRAKARPDEVLVQVAAKAIAKGTIPPFAPGSQASRSFLDEMPESVIEELGALTAIRLGKGLLASIPTDELRQKVRGNAFYKYTFEWIAPLLYHWARMRRTQPNTVIIFNTAIPVFSLTVLALDGTLAFFGVHMAYRTWGVLVGVPLLVLWVWSWLFRR